MKKIFRVFYSQLFNVFFPIVLLLILNRIINQSGVSSIFLLTNYANFYLLFSDYSSNIVFLKESLQHGGITNKTSSKTITNINTYLGLKLFFLTIGFFVWIVLCTITPALYDHFFISVLSYTFIVAYNLNFYWIYMSSSKEFYFIITNFISRLVLITSLLFCVYLKVTVTWVMPIVGFINVLICLAYFRKFCKYFAITLQINYQTILNAIQVIKQDFKLISGLILLMTPSNCLFLFLGYVKSTNTIVVFGFAQQIFFGIRSLLSIFINSIYPGLCNNTINKKRKNQIFILFYVVIFLGCLILFFIKSEIGFFLKLSGPNMYILNTSLNYFIAAILVLSVNVPFMLWAMLHDILHKKKMVTLLLIASAVTIGVFLYHLMYENSAINIAKSVFIAEAAILITFILLYYKYKKASSIFLPQ